MDSSNNLSFGFPTHLSKFNIPIAEFIASNPQYSGFVVGAYILSRTNTNTNTTTSAPTTATTPDAGPRLLLLQRDLLDSYGGFWEGPGGSCELTDPTLLSSLVREVLEETGLHVSYIRDLVQVDEWEHKKGKNQALAEELGRKPMAGKFSFVVDVHEASGGGDEWEGQIKLMDGEHQQYCWAGEEEVRRAFEVEVEEDGGAGLGGESRFKFHGDKTTILKAFEIWRRSFA